MNTNIKKRDINDVLNKSVILPIYERNFDKIQNLVNSDFNNNEEVLLHNFMKDKNNEWYKMTYDVAMCYPMLEMAGLEHVFYNEKKLYVYNRNNPISDDKVNQMLQWQIHDEINKKKPFKKIESYK